MSSEPSRPEKGYFHNWVSILGIFASVFLFLVILFLILVDLFSQTANLYLSGLAYIIFPGFWILSLILIPIGAFFERRRRHLRGAAPEFPRIDLNDSHHRNLVLIVLGFGMLFVLFSCFGAYRAYHYTESVAFCGKMCHQVMEPEHTAYQKSPHAKVACVQCHIGPGAGWFVRSKMSGLYQIYSVFFHLYSRPIKTPVKDLRPAQDTCEQCHWPEHFFGAVEQDHQYFLPDEKNSSWKTRMLMFVGGGDKARNGSKGIHWHTDVKNKIEYVATDEKRQEIPWIRKTDSSGKQEVFVAEGTDFSAEKPPAGEVRKMDCIDCHNRPSHIYEAPLKSVNEAMASGGIDPALPFIKRETVNALAGKYETKEEAEAKIAGHLRGFYRKTYPDLTAAQKESLEKAILSVQEIYRTNFFPYMKVSWKEYPNNIGHFIFPGCFRCHDGQHKTSEGKAIGNDCATCHNVIAQGPPDVQDKGVDGLDYKHPEDIGTSWKEMKCSECHSGE